MSRGEPDCSEAYRRLTTMDVPLEGGNSSSAFDLMLNAAEG